MTRDAEHTPTGYEDAASVVVNQAHAPSSLAGGDVTDEWADRFCEAVNWSPDGQECKTVEGELRCTTFRQIAKGHILTAIATNPYPDNAAISPEAPAGEGVTHPDAQPFERFPELALHIERMAMTGLVGSMISWDAFLRELNAALTPRHEAPACSTCGGKGYTEHEGGYGEGYPSRPEIEDCPKCHEAPASEDEARRKLIQCIEQWDGETEYDADDLASLADGILHAFNGPPVVSRAAPVELSSNPCQLEDPAEGAGGGGA